MFFATLEFAKFYGVIWKMIWESLSSCYLILSKNFSYSQRNFESFYLH